MMFSVSSDLPALQVAVNFLFLALRALLLLL